MALIKLFLKIMRYCFKDTSLTETFLYRRWFPVLFALLVGERISLVDFRGRLLKPNPKDISISPSLFTGQFEANELDWLFNRYSRITGKCLLIDVGCNIGIYSSIWCSISANFEALCIEPDSRSIPYLRENLMRNSFDSSQYKIHEVAIGTVNSTRWLNLASNPGQSGFYRTKSSDLLRVKVLRLQDLVTCLDLDKYEEILLKIDVEGSETECLDSAGTLLDLRHLSLLIEFNPARTDRRLIIKRMDFLFRKYGKALVMSQNTISTLTNDNFVRHFPSKLANFIFEANR